MNSCAHKLLSIIFIFCFQSLIFGCNTNTRDLTETSETATGPIVPIEARNLVGVVDMQRLSQGLGLNDQLIQKRQQLQRDWDKVNDESRAAMEEKLKAFGGDPQQLSEDEKQELQQLEIERRRRLTAVERENNAALQEMNRWLRRVLMEKTGEPINAIGKEKGFQLILRRSPNEVAFIEPGVDITDLVLKRTGGQVSNNEADPAPETTDKSPVETKK
jgi:Skp family chaperone for outer membrane proteins